MSEIESPAYDVSVHESPAYDVSGPATAYLSALQPVLDEVIVPAAEDVDRDHLFPRQGVQALVDAGLGGLLIPREFGGPDAGLVVYAEVLARIAAACGSTSTVYMTNLHCAHPIVLGGRVDQQRRWVPALGSGQAFGATALTESEAGSDVASMRTYARRDGDSYVINGSKMFISNGDVADVLVLFATVDPALGRDGITAFLLDTAHLSGFGVGRPMDKLGQRGASTVPLSFDHCRVPADAVLGEVGRGWALLLQAVLRSRISAAAQGVGFATGAFETVVAYCAKHGLLTARNRAAQDLQFDLAALRAEISAARALLLHACAATDAVAAAGGADPTALLAEVKLHCTRVGVQVAARCLELLGGEADRLDVGLERRLRDAKITEIYDGTNQVQSMLIARDLRFSPTAMSALDTRP
ncbi:acyl-CoA dehydrogenase [Microlunatus phosphovorus NM-1]|uniref:Acyl-CoA dehydrogenase n=1 Tax=Microlunatus phosphovorus (strain ATCC 700054 / DSM 10555 / JCM 9379 / NBRC 101784 / NCIMB 13414 / VKM Ac-1990 / NM-1) TaxID=1032480 RepID=F5XMR5_MICPN|nr:acyl-CoA dehydrogenase family protein [Microlunatus phosphovorus]BAK33988.1 acyl-CoA dehydrogenase [Microlunatus phosphovorus NM-1]